jgi:hypothetical protein
MELPKDMKYEIVKNLSFYRTLNKELHKDTSSYYEKFCNKPITINEFKKYIESGEEGYLITPKDNELYIIYVTHRNVPTSTAYIYHIKQTNRLITHSKRINYEDFNINDYINTDSYYDMITTFYILEKRDCHQDDYIMTQLMKNINQFSNDIPTTNINQFLYNVEKYMYEKLSTGYNITLVDFNFNQFTFIKGIPNINIDYHVYDLNFDKMKQSLLFQLKFL